MDEMPSVSSFTNVSHCYNPHEFGNAFNLAVGGHNTGTGINFPHVTITKPLTYEQEQNLKKINEYCTVAKTFVTGETTLNNKETTMTEKLPKRIVRVFIVDPDDNIPLDKAILQDSEERLTDLTDQELFLEVGIKEILRNHNDYRKTLLDKKQTAKAGKDVFLEAIRIRDLKMLVTTIAEF